MNDTKQSARTLAETIGADRDAMFTLAVDVLKFSAEEVDRKGRRLDAILFAILGGFAATIVATAVGVIYLLS